ncbi:hypothetical protein A2851_01175 [Candidatus Kaiserbacteria bacterium RIFCSPHIGHO2_01_FULL_53_29]|uniref:Glycerol-3-phosphate dehydrogenase [NAD(P)+] n=1 Tax=Candidatus Kaiserbacteria bacterium RIFCSPHIGHO2_01_FULL_53_29 TaxID=1798480 RepID=A0A1F6CYL0_9BACT|nr:MAG: hypothetical protein A2851_01175 [Candidatus Kaiserbacteria bacterium RIFCSPHIGHO2_01_FULL_53_29]
MSKVVIIPAGQWGTALAVPLRDNGRDVVLWQKRAKMEAIANVEFLILAPPSAIFREIAADVLPKLSPHTIVISVTKGLEDASLMRTSQIVEELSPHHARKFTVLSGPSFAGEVSQRKPTAVVAASHSSEASEKVQRLFCTENFRVYRTKDVIGVELGGMLKNIVALAAGISDGMGCGDNARAALITRGFREMVILARAEGAREQTLRGLSGIGDLILTCTSVKSRNYSTGFSIGRSGSVGRKRGITVEGIRNAQLVLKLSERNRLDLPLFSQIAKVVAGERSPQTALKELMTRSVKDEDLIF